MGHSDQSDSSHQSEPGKFKERVTDQNSRVPGKRSDTVIQMVGRNTARPKVKSVPLFQAFFFTDFAATTTTDFPKT